MSCYFGGNIRRSVIGTDCRGYVHASEQTRLNLHIEVGYTIARICFKRNHVPTVNIPTYIAKYFFFNFNF